jgi:hypothetical protein
LSILELDDHLVDTCYVLVRFFSHHVLVLGWDTINVTLDELSHIVAHILGRVMDQESTSSLLIVHIDLGDVLGVDSVEGRSDIFVLYFST